MSLSKESAQQYRQIDAAFWERYGLSPKEQMVEVGTPATTLRVLEWGDGPPVFFIHGNAGPGACFAPLIAELSGHRCLVLERPGWGLSSPIDYSQGEFKSIVASLLASTLERLGVDKVSIVAGSIGNLWALRFAQAHPSRVERLVLLGGGPLTSANVVPKFVKLLRSPLGNIIIRVPERNRMLQQQLRGLGHGPSLDSGQIPKVLLDWHMGMSRTTSWTRNERAMVKAIVGPEGFVPGLVLDDAEVARIDQPTLMIYGTADPNGSVEIWKRFVGLMPRGSLKLVENAGHVVWYDDPTGVGAMVNEFLKG